MFINEQAKRTKRREIVTGRTLTEFVGKLRMKGANGRTITAVDDQLIRLVASSMRVGLMVTDCRAKTSNFQIAKDFEIWFSKEDRKQRGLWPSVVTLSPEYFESLREHAVPMDEAHIVGLSHSALALDIYTWLVSRLHRIPAGKPVRVPWPSLHNQFGQGYDPNRINKFRQVFRVALKQVLTVYRDARVEDDVKRPPARLTANGWREEVSPGLLLHKSPPPVPPVGLNKA
jgi:hypothetical protein